MLVTLLSKSLRNLLLPGILKLFLLCLLAYLISFSALAWGLSVLVGLYIGTSSTTGFMMHLIASMGGVMAAWALFPLLYPLLISFFDDRIANIIEREDYPHLKPPEPPFWPTIMHDVTFSIKAIALNILCLVLWLIPPVYIVVYYGMNGYLLGMQFFRMIAGRRVSVEEAQDLQKKARHTILLIGVAISFFATVPFLNLVAPLIGIAAMLHLFQSLRGGPQQEILPPGTPA